MRTIQQRVLFPLTVHIGFVDRHVIVGPQVDVFVVGESGVESQGATEGGGLGVVPEALTDSPPQPVHRHLNASVVGGSSGQPEVNTYTAIEFSLKLHKMI